MTNASNESSIQDQISALEALITALEEGADRGLAQLHGRTDPEAIRRKLIILLKENRVAEASELVRGMVPSSIWGEQALIALVGNGDMDEARKLLAWTQNLGDLVTRQRCSIMYARTLLLKTEPNVETGFMSTLELVSDEERSRLQEAVEILSPTILLAKGRGECATELDFLGLTLAMHAYLRLGETDKLNELQAILLKREPVPLLLASLAWRGVIGCPENMPQRLRAEHPKSFEAKLLASLLEGVVLGRPKEAFAAVERLLPEASTAEEKRQVCVALSDTVRELDAANQETAESTVVSLLDPDDPLLRLLKAEWTLRRNETEKAGALLEEIRDEKDPDWLQIYAKYLAQKNDLAGALEYKAKASALFPHPVLLSTVADMALRGERWDVAVDTLRNVVKRDPGNVDALRKLASALYRQQEFSEAACILERLQRIEPGEISHAVYRGFCLLYTNELAHSLGVFQSACRQAQAPLVAFLGWADVLHKLGRLEDAFNSLNTIREKYWDNPEFLKQYLPIAFAANHEADGHRAMLRILELQQEGKVTQKILQIKHLDDIVAIARKGRERRDAVLRFVREGRIPWMGADHLLGDNFYWAWGIRTQNLHWVGDDPLEHAAYAVYSTNGFCHSLETDAQKHLEALKCSERGKPVVMDLSALVTSHRLGILDKIGDFFGEISYPEIYATLFSSTRAKLVPHQMSQERSLKAIGEALAVKRIRVIGETGDAREDDMPYVNEHLIDGEHSDGVYGLCDIGQFLKETGRISQSIFDRLMTSARKSTIGDSCPLSVRMNAPIRVQLQTLQSLWMEGVLDTTLEVFVVHITTKDRDEVVGSLRSISFRDEALAWQNELWEILKGDPRFNRKRHIPHPKVVKVSKDELDDCFLASAFLAQELDIPLLADDRVLQMLVQNKAKYGHRSTFSTDHVLVAFMEEGLHDPTRTADCFTQLIRWRYRFVVPPVSVLKTMLDNFRDCPPGQDLQRVALYLHDCMRDRGLFGGPEFPDYPMSMAVNLFLEWTRVVSDLVIRVWADNQYSDEKAQEITAWAVQEFLPSPPLSAGIPSLRLCSRFPRFVISYAMASSLTAKNTDRMNKALTGLGSALGMDEAEYVKTVGEVVNRAG